MIELEICCTSVEQVQRAAEAGATRVELCAALELDGLTPSAGMIYAARRTLKNTQLYPIIRPRGGDFVYSSEELAVIAADIAVAAEAQCDGVVFGILTPSGRVDTAACAPLIKAAHTAGLGTTFHRAFDRVTDPSEALEEVIELGFDRVLSSGRAATAPEGTAALRKLFEQAAGRIQVMAGGGITVENMAELIARTGVEALHGTFRQALDAAAAKIVAQAAKRR